ncbi:MAG: ThiF family adenylyltransferase [Candidatus Taylorbacteria bacterium]|nr:ThiF family adenylyltransferase [Candidatus Taylorbacteria bacterium]
MDTKDRIVPHRSRSTLFNLNNKVEQESFSALTADASVWCDEGEELFVSQERELFEIRNPYLSLPEEVEKGFLEFKKARDAECEVRKRGRWVYYPWLRKAVHILDDAEFFEVRTARNKNLINVTEQKAFYDATVCVAGLSVGGSVALAVVRLGGARRMKLADMDVLALSNTNRLPGGVADLGLPKIELIARQIFEINPYAELQLFPEGLTEENLDEFCVDTHPASVLIDEMDSLVMKCRLREHARRLRIPVVMGTDVASGAVVDVERYDRDPQPAFFHGRMGKVTVETLSSISKKETGALIGTHVGEENHTPRMLESLSLLGTLLTSWPQLYSAALLNASIIATFVLRIVNNQEVKDGRVVVSLDVKSERFL